MRTISQQTSPLLKGLRAVCTPRCTALFAGHALLATVLPFLCLQGPIACVCSNRQKCLQIRGPCCIGSMTLAAKWGSFQCAGSHQYASCDTLQVDSICDSLVVGRCHNPIGNGSNHLQSMALSKHMKCAHLKSCNPYLQYVIFADAVGFNPRWQSFGTRLENLLIVHIKVLQQYEYEFNRFLKVHTFCKQVQIFFVANALKVAFSL